MMNQDYGNQEAPSKGRRQKTTQERLQDKLKQLAKTTEKMRLLSWKVNANKKS